MISPYRSLKCCLVASVMMTLCASAQASSISVSVDESGLASLVLVYEGKVINGFQSVDNGLTQMSLNSVVSITETRVAGTGTGGSGGGAPEAIFDDAHAIGFSQEAWGSTEVVFGCYSADVVLYRNDKNGNPEYLAAGSVVTQYCPAEYNAKN